MFCIRRFQNLKAGALFGAALLAITLALPRAARAADNQPGPILEPEREFRAAWVATVANIDWPSKPGLSTADQKAEAIAILDKLVELNMNAVVFQVRPHCDTMYASDLEPWSYYLTGKEGKAPDPFYDPLEFWVAESHARGLEFHAWFNPYRANHPSMKGDPAPNAVRVAHPEMVVKLGDKGYYWLDPALQSVKDHSTAVVMDVVNRYDVDGIHFDDYFYPYDSYNDGKDFPDDASWAAYQATGGTMIRNDWRRAAVDSFIENLYREIKAAKRHVKFGLSPFGIWRPGHPRSIQGLDQYDSLFADAKLWFNRGWVDYYTPQLYWPVAKVPQSFPVLLGWWQEQNTMNRHLWPGMSVGRGTQGDSHTEVLNQIMVTRGIVRENPGNVFFSMKVFMKNTSDLNTGLLEGPYAYKVLAPASPWLDNVPPAAPKVESKKQGDSIELAWKGQGGEAAFVWAVGVERGGKNWSYQILPAAAISTTVAGPFAKAGADKPDGAAATRVAVWAVDRTGMLSEPAVTTIAQ